jgi:hypothetical protein
MEWKGVFFRVKNRFQFGMCFEWNRELFFLQAKIDFDLEFALNGIKKCFFNIIVMDDEGDE